MYTLGGFGFEVAQGVAKICDWDLSIVETKFKECWDFKYPGIGMMRGNFHGCMTYTHTYGVRPRMLDFSNGILQNNKPAGMLVRLDENGEPEIKGTDNLDGITIADVRGWAPTDDALNFVNNTCSGKPWGNYNMLIPEKNGNDAAMKMMLDKRADGTYEADAVWLYADQAKNYNCTNAREKNLPISWDCNIWDGFGTKFAYIHTGMFNHAINGTTLTISRKGSGLNDIVNPCI